MPDIQVTYEMCAPKTPFPMNATDWQHVGKILVDDVRQGIDNQIDVRGIPYPLLKPNTIASKRQTIQGETKAKGQSTSAYPTKRLINTGNLRTNQRINATNDAVEITIGPTRAAIASYQQHGIKPHVIVPKKPKGVLAFQTVKGLQFAKRVQHPGTPPVPFFGISKNAALSVMNYFIDQTDRWLRRIK